jgi:annexin A7/11
LKAMGSQSAETRCKVPLRYKELFGKKLDDVMKTECGNKDFGTALQFLAQNPVDAECDMIMSACKGLGTKEKLLGTIICGRSNAEMTLLKKKFFDLHTKDLYVMFCLLHTSLPCFYVVLLTFALMLHRGRVLDSELGGAFEALVFNCLQAADEEYDPKGEHSEDKMKEEAKALYEMGQGKFGTNEKGLFKILVCAPSEYLKLLNLHYADKYGLTLLKALETEMPGDTGEAALFMLKMKIKPYEAVAELIDDALRGVGTKELLLTCTLIRYQCIMKQVAAAHLELYGSSIEDRIKSETKRDFEKILLEIVAAGN